MVYCVRNIVTRDGVLLICKDERVMSLNWQENDSCRELISKRELLMNYSISYGALYRWKRKGLIPEEWFIKKTCPTGQETFFPRALICERVELILERKEEYLLDELAGQLNSESRKRAVMVVKTVYGDKTFYVDELKAVLIDNGVGEPEDITERITGVQNP